MPEFNESENRFFQNYLVTLEIRLAAEAEAAGAPAVTNRDLESVRRLLERLKTGTFGECEECADEIPYGRLRTSPENPRCADCSPTEEHEYDFDLG